MSERLTLSERAAERYFSSHQIQCTRIPRGGGPTADYVISADDRSAVVEVKEFGKSEKIVPGGYCPVPFVRAKIWECWRQLEPYKDSACCVLLAGGTSFKVCLDPELLICAMFGEMCERLEPGSYRFFGPAAMVPGRNSKISAVVGLFPLQIPRNCVEAGRLEFALTGGTRQLTESEADNIRTRTWPLAVEVETTIRAVSVANPWAKKRMPKAFFGGPYDEHWLRGEDGIVERVDSGGKVAELRKLLPEYLLKSMGIW